MKSQKLMKGLNLGVIIGILVATVSFLISLVPCKKEAGIGVCTLPNPFSDLSALTLSDKYYFISNNPMTGLILQFLIPFIITLIIIFGRKTTNHERVVDYTKK